MTRLLLTSVRTFSANKPLVRTLSFNFLVNGFLIARLSDVGLKKKSNLLSILYKRGCIWGSRHRAVNVKLEGGKGILLSAVPVQ